VPGPAAEDRPRFYRRLLLVTCAVGLLHAALYAAATPVFESPDEPYHLAYVNFVATRWQIPDQYDPASAVPVEGHQHPAYYVLAAAVVRASGATGIEARLPVAREFRTWVYRHDVDPFATTADRARFYALRLFGALLMALTVLQVGRAAAAVFPDHLAAAALAPMLVAGLPQFAFVCAAVSNDGLTALASASAIGACARAARAPRRHRGWVIAGLWLGLALLSKKSALAILPALAVLALFPPGGTAAGGSGERRPLAERLRGPLLAIGVALLVVAGLLVRNQVLYAEWLGTQMEVNTLPGLVEPRPLLSSYFVTTFPSRLWRSYIAHLGHASVPVPGVILLPLAALVFVPLAVGLLPGRLLAGRDRAFLTACLLLNVAAVVFYNLTFSQAQGRLLFPSLAAAALLWAAGMARLRPARRSPRPLIAVVGLLLLAGAALTLAVAVRAALAGGAYG
jgi:hypothetical protein